MTDTPRSEAWQRVCSATSELHAVVRDDMTQAEAGGWAIVIATLTHWGDRTDPALVEVHDAGLCVVCESTQYRYEDPAMGGYL